MASIVGILRVRRDRSNAAVVMLRLFAAVTALPLAACSAQEREPIDIGTTTQGSIGYATSVALAQVFFDKAGIRGRIQPNSGGGALLAQVNNGELDFGISAVGEVEEAYLGQNVFKNRPQQNLRAVTVLYPIRSAIFVREGSDIHAISDLRGRRVTAGFEAMPAVEGIFAAALGNGNLSRDDIEPVMVPNVTRGADDFVSGRADAFFFGVGAAKVLEVDASVGGVRALPLDTSHAALQRMRQQFRYGYALLERPSANSVGVSEPVYVLAYDNLLVTHVGMSEERVREVLTLIAENGQELTAIMPQFSRFSDKEMFKDLPLDYHHAALDWYRERGTELSSLPAGTQTRRAPARVMTARP